MDFIKTCRVLQNILMYVFTGLSNWGFHPMIKQEPIVCQDFCFSSGCRHPGYQAPNSIHSLLPQSCGLNFPQRIPSCYSRYIDHQVPGEIRPRYLIQDDSFPMDAEEQGYVGI